MLALLVGKFTGNPEGVTNDEVSIKKISNKNITSVMEAMLKAGSTLFFDRKFMTSRFWVKTIKTLLRFLQQVDKLDGRVFHFVNHLLYARHQKVVGQIGHDSHDQPRHGGDHGGINTR